MCVLCLCVCVCVCVHACIRIAGVYLTLSGKVDGIVACFLRGTGWVPRPPDSWEREKCTQRCAVQVFGMSVSHNVACLSGFSSTQVLHRVSLRQSLDRGCSHSDGKVSVCVCVCVIVCVYLCVCVSFGMLIYSCARVCARACACMHAYEHICEFWCV